MMFNFKTFLSLIFICLGAIFIAPSSYASYENTQFVETEGVRYPKAFQKAYERIGLTEEQANTWGIVEILPDNSENPPYIHYLMIPWYNTISSISFSEIDNSTDYVNFTLSSFPENAGAVDCVVTNFKGDLNQMDVTLATPVSGISGYHARYNFVLPSASSIYPLVYEYFKPLRTGSDIITIPPDTLDTLSNSGLLSELYDISFIVQGVSDEKHSSLISRSLDVTPLAVRDDTGYNLIYLEIPQLGTDLYFNDVVWGYYLFRPRYTTDKYFFNGFKLSFAYDPLKDVEDLDDYPADSFFELSVNSQPVRSGGSLTVNSMSFLFGGSVHSYNNRVLNIYDYSSDSNNLYPTFLFHSVATCNRYSAGSFCYNFDDSGLMKVDEQGNSTPATPEDKDDLSKKGDDRNDDTKKQLGFLPRNVRFNTLNDSFSWDNGQQYDFSSVGSLLGALFSNSFIITIATACCVVGLIGYVLYGKN